MENTNDGPSNSKEKGEDVLNWIELIKEGKLNPTTLKDVERRECVQFLRLKNSNKYQIAKFLGVCERTIRRDLEKIREENAVKPTPKMIQEVIGESQENIKAIVEALNRIADSPETGKNERIRALHASGRLIIEWLRALQASGLAYSKTMEGILNDS